MKISEIIQRADAMVPNTIANELKVDWINDVERYIFGELYQDMRSDVQDVQYGQASYDMNGYRFSDIKDVYVNGIRYAKMGANNYLTRRYSYYDKDGSLNIYPETSSDVSGGLKVFYLYCPPDKTIDNMDADLGLTGIYDNHKDLYLFYLMAQITYAQKEYEDYNNHSLRFNREVLNFQAWVRRTQPDNSTGNQFINLW